METKKNQVVHNQAKTWQIALFALNNTATNLYMFAFMFIAYYATGVAGLVVVAVSTVLTFMRVWDGFTDPIIGFIIDRTKTKFGKFRPFMILGNVILAILTLVIFRTTHLVPEGLRFIYFVLMYGIYIIGYSFQTTCTRAAQTALTNDPKQRPMFSLFDALYNSALFIGIQNFVAVYLVPKHGGFTLSFFNEFTVIAIITSAVFTLLAVMAISSKDVEENWGIPGDKPVKFSEYWPILKGNRPLQMLVVSAATDKLAMTTRQNAVVSVIIYGILMSNYALSGQLMLITTPATIIITFIGIGYARKMGIKKAYVAATWICIALSAVFFIFLRMIDMTTISLVNFNTNTFVFLALLSLITGVSAVGGNIVIPMIADCSDYETYKSGRYIPGMIGTIFSFVDKLVSSLSATFVGFTVALIGFRDAFPEVDTPASPGLFWVGMFLFIGLPVLGWLASLVAMRFYELDGQRMEEIQQSIHDKKMEAGLSN